MRNALSRPASSVTTISPRTLTNSRVFKLRSEAHPSQGAVAARVPAAILHYPSQVATGDTLTILVVDDERDLRTIARVSLHHLGGFNVVEAASGAEAIEMAARLKPALVLLDVMMPAMDGTEVFCALRDHPATSALPVVFLTAKAMPGELDRLHSMGALAILTKPFDPAALVALVRRVLDEPATPKPNGAGSSTKPAPPQPSILPDIDAEALRCLWELPGETQTDLLGELIEIFAAHTPEAISCLRDHAAAGVMREAERLAHSLKGSALTLGATGIAELARTIESLAGEGRTAEIPPLIDRIDALLGPTLDRLRAERDCLAAGVES